jgi:capsular polysaccharide transport system permease protein
MIEVSIKMPSGIVEFKVRAFDPSDAALIGNAVLEISEALINDLNRRMNDDAVKSATQQLEKASLRLVRARVALEKARNEGGLLDVTKTADALNGLITETKGALLQLQQDYDTQRNSVDESAPQMRALKSRIDATKAQIAELESKLTGPGSATKAESSLAGAMTKIAALDLEQQIAQRLYAAAASSLEAARLIAENKLMYIDAFVRPAVPEDPQYPLRTLFSILIFAVCLAAWGSVCGLATLVRNHMA